MKCHTEGALTDVERVQAWAEGQQMTLGQAIAYVLVDST